MKQCYLGLGGNITNELGTPTEHIKNAVQAIYHSSHFANVQVSSLYQSKAFGVTDQPDFINAVLKANTDLTPLGLLEFCQSLEQSAKRERLRHWGERSLDVDILLYGEKMIQSERLTIPHKGLFERNFVLVPLLELDKTLMVQGRLLKDEPMAKDMTGLKKID